MSFRFCADGVAVLGTVRILAAQSKRRSSAGACVDGNWTQLSPASRSRPCKIEIQGQKSMAGFKQPDFIEPREAAAKARKLALEKFRAKAADPALAERLTARAARAAEALSSLAANITSTKALLEVLKETCVEINLLIDRAIERPHRGFRKPTAGLRCPGEHDQRRRLVGSPSLREYIRPHCLRTTKDGRHKLAHCV